MTYLYWEINQYGEFAWFAPDNEDGVFTYQQLDAETAFNL